MGTWSIPGSGRQSQLHTHLETLQDAEDAQAFNVPKIRKRSRNLELRKTDSVRCTSSRTLNLDDLRDHATSTTVPCTRRNPQEPLSHALGSS